MEQLDTIYCDQCGDDIDSSSDFVCDVCGDQVCGECISEGGDVCLKCKEEE